MHEFRNVDQATLRSVTDKSILLSISQGCWWPRKWAPYMGALSAAGWAWSLHGKQTWIGNR